MAETGGLLSTGGRHAARHKKVGSSSVPLCLACAPHTQLALLMCGVLSHRTAETSPSTEPTFAAVRAALSIVARQALLALGVGAAGVAPRARARGQAVLGGAAPTGACAGASRGTEQGCEAA